MEKSKEEYVDEWIEIRQKLLNLRTKIKKLVNEIDEIDCEISLFLDEIFPKIR